MLYIIIIKAMGLATVVLENKVVIFVINIVAAAVAA
jgi:hypothetical protein